MISVCVAIAIDELDILGHEVSYSPKRVLVCFKQILTPNYLKIKHFSPAMHSLFYVQIEIGGKKEMDKRI